MVLRWADKSGKPSTHVVVADLPHLDLATTAVGWGGGGSDVDAAEAELLPGGGRHERGPPGWAGSSSSSAGDIKKSGTWP